MRVAHFDTGRSWRGGQAQVLMLLEGQRARGHDVVLVAPPGPLADRAAASGLPVNALRTLGELDPTSGIRAARRLSPWRPDLLHAHTAHAHTIAARAAGRLGCPLVVSRRVTRPVGRSPLGRRKYSRGVARFLCISRAVVEAMRASGVAPERLALVPSGVDVESLAALRARVAEGRSAASLRAVLGAGRPVPVVGTSAAVSEEKGPEVFLDAAAEVAGAGSAAHFVWIGEGRLRGWLERSAARRGLAGRVHAPGFRSDAAELVAQLDLFVSASRAEGLGTAVLEAQALGVPVVAVDSGGVRDSIEDGVNGRIVTAGSLGSAILAALADPDVCRRWATAALDSVRRFSPAAMVDRTLEEYMRVVDEAARNATC